MEWISYVGTVVCHWDAGFEMLGLDTEHLNLTWGLSAAWERGPGSGLSLLVK